MYKPTYLVFTALFMAGVSQAKVVENVHYLTYQVMHQKGHSLRDAINAVTPISEAGQKFHGYTKWFISWNYTWNKKTDGRCRITSTTISNKASITLPKLVSSDQKTISEFNRYLQALTEHEHGHLANARQAAHQIDQSVSALPEMASCEQLTAAINAIGHQLVKAANQEDIQYDQKTQHGRNQGAVISE